MSDAIYRRAVVFILLGILFVQTLSFILGERHIVTNQMLNEAKEIDGYGRLGDRDHVDKLVNRMPLVSVNGNVDVSGSVEVGSIRDTVDVRIENEQEPTHDVFGNPKY